MKNSSNIYYKIATTEKEFNQVFYVRKNVLVKELNYSESMIHVEKNNAHIHIIAIENEKPIGVITINYPDKQNKLALEYHCNISQHRTTKDVEFKRLAVIDYKNNLFVGAILIGLAFNYAKERCIQNIFLTSPVTNYHINLYKKYSAKRLVKFNYCNTINLYALVVKIKNTDNIKKFKRTRALYNKLYQTFKKENNI
jgi:hypothetical protein